MFKRVVILGVTYYLQVTGAASAECRDLNGRRIAQGIHYVPGPDACTLCVCDSGNPKWCKAVLCSPPQDCKSFRVGSTCCEFICLDDTLSKSDGGLDLDGSTDLGLRLVASAVTVILTLSLLFFFIHRLRQRKLRGRQNRQLSEDERSLGSIGYIAGSIGYLQGSMGYLGNGSNDLEFHYEEPPSHYPLWKPPGNYFPRGEAPPPYEEAVAAARAEAALIASTVAASAVQYSAPPSVPQPVAIVPAHSTLANHVRSEIATAPVSTINTAHRIEVVNVTPRPDNGRPSTQRNENANITEHNPRIETGKIISADAMRSDYTTTRSERGDRLSQPSGISLISHNSHRTIPKNLATSSSLRAEPLITNESSIRRETAKENAPVETKSLPKQRATILKEKRPDVILSLRPDIYYEDIIPPPSCSRETYITDSSTSRHRTIPRHISSSGLNNTNTTPHSNYNISNTPVTLSALVTPRAHSMQYTSNIISLPTSPVPPPVVFSNTACSACEQTAKDNNTLTAKNNSSSTSSKPTSSPNAPLLEKEPTQYAQSPSVDVDSSLDGSYQCLHQTFDDGDDYRSECENCKSAHGSRYYLAEDDDDELSSPNETMTLQRRPLEPPTDTLGHGPSYYRTSLTLPTNTKKLRSTSMHGTPSNHGAREAWFSSMPESTSSEED